MSKITQRMESCLAKPFANTKEAVEVANTIMLTKERPTKIVRDTQAELNNASDHLKKCFDNFNTHFESMVQHEIDMYKRTKTLTSNLKNYVGQVGEAMARIDKLVGVDFEKRLVLLERFVSASESLAKLEADGKLSKIMGAFK